MTDQKCNQDPAAEIRNTRNIGYDNETFPCLGSVLIMIEEDLTIDASMPSRAIYITRELERSGISTILLGAGSDRNDAENYVENVIYVKKNSSSHLGYLKIRLNLIKMMVKILKNEKINHVIIRGSVLSALMLPILKLFKVKGFYDFHGYSYLVQLKRGWKIRPMIYRFLENLCLSRYDYVITQNLYNKELASQLNSNVLYLDNGVNIDRFTRDESVSEKDCLDILERFGIPDNKMLVGFVAGFIGDWVDLDCMLQASNLCPGTVHFVIISGDRRIENIDMSCYQKVTFTGKVENHEVKTLLNMFDMCTYAITSKYADPFHGAPRKIREWIAMELPIVITDIRPKPSYLEDGENALFCKPADPEDMADKITRLSLDPGMRKRMKERSAELRSSVSWEHTVLESGILDKLGK